MEPSILRRKDTTKGPPLRVLSLDGGGVRGYSMLILLQELMYRVYVETEGTAPKHDEIPKPCEYFDLIAGTGTGGLIAIMLGRLRMDIETCKDVYVRMTKYVFQTDKTIAGIPYRSTLFKASKLEEAIRECVRDHTVSEEEGNDGTVVGGRKLAPLRTASSHSALPQRTGSRGSVSNPSLRSPSAAAERRTSVLLNGLRFGNPNASLYDSREDRTKTAVTAVYKGTPKGGAPALLRSYDSRKEPAPEYLCTIWQAGRATSATQLAFKPIEIGHSLFLDEGAGRYNPAPQILDEAAVNEWPGREIGAFVSIGTGKRPSGSSSNKHEWWEGFVGSGMGDFADARRRLIAKIEECEDTHQYMLRDHLRKRGVNAENYCRLNVDIGVGEFGMNEWDRMTEISTNTRRYLGKSTVQKMILDTAVRMAKIERSKRRQAGRPGADMPAPGPATYTAIPPPSNPLAIELPGDEIMVPNSARPLSYPESSTVGSPTSGSYRQSLTSMSSQDKFVVISPHDEHFASPTSSGPRRSNDIVSPIAPSTRRSGEETRPSTSGNTPYVTANPSPRRSAEHSHPPPPTSNPSSTAQQHPPPVPPKTPMPFFSADDVKQPLSAEPPLSSHPALQPTSPTGGVPMVTMMNGRPIPQIRQNGKKMPLPYPDDEISIDRVGSPPVVNMARKPEFTSGGGRRE